MANQKQTGKITMDERRNHGQAARESAPLASHKGWEPSSTRRDPIDLLVEQNERREPDLVPVRHGRMTVSPFTFYRGAARIMASDLAGSPTAGINVQLCGDAHLSNFGLFGSPERTLLFDLNDFDETLPGPFEFDVKRMAASFNIAARNNGFTKADRKAITRTSVRSYREAIMEFSQMRTLDIWYARLSESDLIAALQARAKAKRDKQDASAARVALKGSGSIAKKAHSRDSLQALSKLAELVDGTYRIVSDPPVVVPARELGAVYNLSADQIGVIVREIFDKYLTTLQFDRQELLRRYEIVDVARKVVGVGSVGTRGYIALLLGRDEQDPLFLQVKEATSSVLEDCLPKSEFREAGERVVQGQRMMQAASDIFLGWTPGVDETRHYYWRQLRDMKGSIDVELMKPFGLNLYASICGWTLARAHARSGDVVALAEYLGLSEEFEKSIGDFSERYAEQNERDYERFGAAIAKGDVEAVYGV
jgi:uncharacterized protein (DUF2252 family)